MFPFVHIHLLGEFHTNTLMLVMSLVISVLIFLVFLRGVMPWWKTTAILVAGALTSFLGARLFHVFIEKPAYFLAHPQEIFTQFDGMTFYGALIAGILFVLISSKVFDWSMSLRARFWDASVLSTCLTLFLMRIGCFANGCCWGKITAHPWGVQYYDPRSVMPYKGIPVHPVQLYDAFIGLVLFVLLFIWWKEKSGRGKLIWGFAITYPVSRFITEFFRGDSFRGEDILLGLSTSQLISVLLFVIGVMGLFLKRKTPTNYLV